jgi:hypothetical protein
MEPAGEEGEQPEQPRRSRRSSRAAAAGADATAGAPRDPCPPSPPGRKQSGDSRKGGLVLAEQYDQGSGGRLERGMPKADEPAGQPSPGGNQTMMDSAELRSTP